VAIIKSMVKQLEFPIEIVVCPIVREEEGLAMSSRNIRLNEKERKAAPLIARILFTLKEKRSFHSVSELIAFAEAQIKSEPLMELEYFEIVDATTLQPLKNYEVNSAVACIAVKLGNVRLIDNIILF
jgi:pantoate--beta-alanine ligase